MGALALVDALFETDGCVGCQARDTTAKEKNVAKVNVSALLDAGVHFGHQKRRWNPKMKPYIYGVRNGITIFDLTVTMKQLAEACRFLRDTVAEGGEILFVGAKRQAQQSVREAAEETGMHVMCDRWLGGTLTNHKVVASRIEYLKKLRKMEEDGTFETLPKKEVSGLRREREKLERTLGGIADMRKMPAAIVIVDIIHEDIALAEANRLGIPVVALVDSNCNPDLVDYVVSGNDDALKSIRVIVGALKAAVNAGNMVSGKDIGGSQGQSVAEGDDGGAPETPEGNEESKPETEAAAAPAATETT